MLAALGIYGHRWDYCAAASGFPGGKDGGCVSITFMKSRGRFLWSVNKICHEYLPFVIHRLFHFRNSIVSSNWYDGKVLMKMKRWTINLTTYSWKLKRNKYLGIRDISFVCSIRFGLIFLFNFILCRRLWKETRSDASFLFFKFTQISRLSTFAIWRDYNRVTITIRLEKLKVKKLQINLFYKW